jgi:hypothetical protein
MIHAYKILYKLKKYGYRLKTISNQKEMALKSFLRSSNEGLGELRAKQGNGEDIICKKVYILLQ